MAEHDSIEQAKESLRLELADLEGRTAKVRQALRSLEELAAPSGNGRIKGTTVPHNRRLHGVTMIKAAAMVLKDAHQPLHVSAIMDRMLQGGYRAENPKSLRLSLVGSLDRGSRPETPGWFYKPAPATYGLREWQETAQKEG